MSTNKNLDLQSIVSRVLSEMKEECQKEGSEFSMERINLAEFQRRSGLSRERSRTLQRHKFEVRPHGNTGKKRERTVISGFDECLSDELRTGLTNSDVLLRMLRERGIFIDLLHSKTRILILIIYIIWTF